MTNTPASAGHGTLQRVAKFALLAAVGAGLTLATFLYDPRNLLETDSVELEAGRDTTTVALGSLSEQHTADGSLIFAGAVTVRYSPSDSPPGAGANAATLVVTSIIREATGISRGDVLWRLGNDPTVAFYGALPSYRDLATDSEGTDVRQLEENLVILGYDPDETVTVDDTYTTNTSLMVQRWQTDIGAQADGRVAQSALIYLPGPSRAATINVAVGDTVRSGVEVLELTGPRRELVVLVPAIERYSLARGDLVEGRLPDRTTFMAEVTDLEVDSQGGVLVTAAPTEIISYTVDTVPVTVSWTVAIGENLLTVPAAALVHTDSGGYFVEVVKPNGEVRMVPVEIGRSAGSTVEVSGAITEGTVVISP